MITRGYCGLAAVAVLLGGCITKDEPRWQGWKQEERTSWYAASQGSRLMPYSWFTALHQPGTTAPFADKAYLATFGLIDAGADSPLPVGFAIDRQDDRAFKTTGLRWYKNQPGKKDTAEPWIGLNCAACHTAEITFNKNSFRAEGGPALFDYQSFVAAINKALVETRDDPIRFNDFARKVLGEAAVQRGEAADLRAALDQLIAWQTETEVRNFKSGLAPPQYGYARVDAFGHIYNKVLAFAGTPAGNPASAPVSYPFLWEIDKQKRVQWNGIVDNQRFRLLGRDVIDYGALGRNSGEVIGVFGELLITENASRLDGYRSSLNIKNLNRMENLVAALEAPKWPSFMPFPEKHEALVARGAQVYVEQRCNGCHIRPEDQRKGEPTERMLSFQDTREIDRTDIWMACNAFTYKAPTKKLAGTRDGFVSGTPLGPEAPVGTMLSVGVKGALVRNAGDIVQASLENLFGVRLPPEITDMFDALELEQQREARRTLCLTYKFPENQKNILAYKARPLDGIWATPPYLHNGSVPTLYHLLLPAAQRPKHFWVGSREYDPKHVGYIWDRKHGPNGFEFNVYDRSGKLIEGNSNAGHEYHVGDLTDGDRWALLEYLKTL